MKSKNMYIYEIGYTIAGKNRKENLILSKLINNSKDVKIGDPKYLQLEDEISFAKGYEQTVKINSCKFIEVVS